MSHNKINLTETAGAMLYDMSTMIEDLIQRLKDRGDHDFLREIEQKMATIGSKDITRPLL